MEELGDEIRAWILKKGQSTTTDTATLEHDPTTAVHAALENNTHPTPIKSSATNIQKTESKIDKDDLYDF
jgi:hypothetical protein